jgi:hypothetical protein
VDGLPGEELGFGDFTLRAEFMLQKSTGDGNDNSGIFVRFRDPRLPRSPGGTPYDNQAYVGVDTGFEIQIDEEARANKTLTPPEPDGLDFNRTGAVYKAPNQQYTRGPQIIARQWYEFQIEAAGDLYTVGLKPAGAAAYAQTTQFEKPASDEFKNRGLGPAQDPHSGFIGLQSHTGNIAFRNIRIKAGTPIA